ncbi:MAG: hypothetical protein WAM61_15225 [Desulfobacterales bacterium]
MADAGHDVSAEPERIAKIEQDIQALGNELAELKREFNEFKKQFY